jgi:hypothetical protein
MRPSKGGFMKGATNLLSTIILGLFCYSFVVDMFDDVWYSKLRYSTQYGAEFSQITKSRKPQDCEFMAAPIGNKSCHYEPQVWAITTGFDKASGRRIVTYSVDGSQEFNDGSNPLKSSVNISWKKVDDE